MSAAEVLALHRRLWSDSIATCSSCDWSRFGNISRTNLAHAQHQLDALKAAGYAVVEVPPGGWVARMVHIDPQEEEGNFLANNGEWYRAVDAARGSDA